MQYFWILLTVMVGFLNQQDKPRECLAIRGGKNVYILSVPDGKITATPAPSGGWPVSAYVSPDGSRQIIGPIASGGPIKVEKLDLPILYANRWRYQYDPYNADASWSLNGKMFVYVRERSPSGETFIGLSDPDGKIQKEVLVSSSSKLLVQLDSWSADSEFFTVLIRSEDSLERNDEKIDLKIFSSLDLKDVTPPEISPIPHNSCDCANWSITGHKIALIKQNDSDFELVVAALDDSTVHRYRIPPLIEGELHDWFVLWSPDGQKIAVTYDAQQPLDEQRMHYEQQLIVFNADGSKQVSVGRNLNSQLHRADGPPVPQWAWSNDSTTLFYVRGSHLDDGNFEAVGYNVMTNGNTALASFPSFNTEVELYPSSDNQSVLVYAYNHVKTSIFLVSSKGMPLWSRLLNAHYRFAFNALTGWSPHRSYLATLKDLDLIVYGSDGKVVLRKRIDKELSTDFMDWVDC